MTPFQPEQEISQQLILQQLYQSVGKNSIGNLIKDDTYWYYCGYADAISKPQPRESLLMKYKGSEAYIMGYLDGEADCITRKCIRS